MRTSLPFAATLVAVSACGNAFSAGGAPADAGADVALADGATDGASHGDDAGSTDGAPDAAADHGIPSGDASCGDTTHSPDNCGRCGHSCLGGGCVSGTCQALTLAGTQAQPTSVVAYDLPGTDTRAIWTQTSAVGAGAISECHFGPGSSCTPAALESGTHPRSLVLTDAMLFWFDLSGTGAVQSLPLVCNPCTATTVADTPAPDWGGTLAADTQNVFWTDDGPAPSGHLYGAPAMASGPSVALVSMTSSYPTAVTIDSQANAVDWVDGLTIEQCPNSLTSCTPTPLATLAGSPTPNAPATLVAYKGTIYWTSPLDGAVAKCTPAVCLTTLKVVARNLSYPVGLKVDDSGIYWAEHGSVPGSCTATAGRIAMCPLSGCTAEPVVLSTGEDCPLSVTTTARAVVWADEGQAGQTAGAVKAIAKP